MKNFLLCIMALFVLITSGIAQNDIIFKINHKLGDADFAMNEPATNNIGHNFQVSRLQYYISEISITHDGGNETAIEETWVLVNAAQATEVALGNYDINDVEAVSFHIGVDSAHNHLDPASYQGSHPLAPQNPSMHWGWAAGYRFIAIEGKGGSNLDQTFELHGLEDANYFQTIVTLSATAENNELIIGLDADYTRALEDIAVNSGVIVHGGYGEAKQAIENFRDYVFSPASPSTSTLDFEEFASFDVFPNPAKNGTATLKITYDYDATYDVVISDILGMQVEYFKAVKNNATIDLQLNKAGMYFISLVKDGKPVLTKKMMSN